MKAEDNRECEHEPSCDPLHDWRVSIPVMLSMFLHSTMSAKSGLVLEQSAIGWLLPSEGPNGVDQLLVTNIGARNEVPDGLE